MDAAAGINDMLWNRSSLRVSLLLGRGTVSFIEHVIHVDTKEIYAITYESRQIEGAYSRTCGQMAAGRSCSGLVAVQIT